MTVDGYLLDTQTICYWFDGAAGQFPKVVAVVDQLPAETPLYVSAITIGEISFGHAINPKGGGTKRSDFERFVQSKLPQTLGVSKHTAEPYGKVRATLAEKYPPPGGWKDKRRAEQMTDPATGRELGIDENDLWIVAQAIERGLVLVTSDKMTKIRDAVAAIYPDLRIVNWAA
jgi:predicted nucleic acid-binding protein